MELIVINGESAKYCLALASKLKTVGFKHLDPSMYFVNAQNVRSFNAKNQVLAKVWCKREALNWVLKGKSVVISATNFNESDLRGFRVVNCHAELLETEGESNATTLSRLADIAETYRQRSVWSQFTERFSRMIRA